MRPSPKSFILDLLSTLRRGTMPVSALVEAGEMFGIRAGNLRVALARLLAAGQVGRDERGRYRLDAGARPVASRVASWRDLAKRTRRWDGAWVAAHLATHAPGIGRAERRGRTRALHLLGFGFLAKNLAVRPDNLRASVADLRFELHALGLPHSDLVFQMRELEPARDTKARSLWDVEGLSARCRACVDELRESRARIRVAAPRDAMVESFLIGGRAVGALNLDPLLPDEICPGAERRELLRTMREYDRLGRAAWAGFLRRHDVPHQRGPIDSRLAATTRPDAGLPRSAPGGREATLP